MRYDCAVVMTRFVSIQLGLLLITTYVFGMNQHSKNVREEELSMTHTTPMAVRVIGMKDLTLKIQQQEVLRLSLLDGFGNLTGIESLNVRQISTGQMPHSCADLKAIGHTLKGIYSVMGATSVETVYCDFSKSLGDPDLQTWIGRTDVKKAPTYFYVQLVDVFDQIETPIPFESEKLNVGGAMDGPSGIFTAPVAGIYYFSFSGIAFFQNPSPESHLTVSLNGNDAVLAVSGPISGTGFLTSTVDPEILPFSLESTLYLAAGDSIWLQIDEMSEGTQLGGDGYTHFNGFLIEEVMCNCLC